MYYLYEKMMRLLLGTVGYLSAAFVGVKSKEFRPHTGRNTYDSVLGLIQHNNGQFKLI